MTLREKLKKGDSVITLEASPPRDSNAREFLQTAKESGVDAVNVPDNQRGVPHLSSLAASKLLLEKGIEPVMHLSCANRNRTEMESMILGAEALGIPNLLIMTGDHPLVADNREAKPVFDTGSVEALELARERSGLFLGAVANHLANPDMQAELIDRKARAGAEFIQTQPVFDIEKLKELMESAGDVKWIPGVMPLYSVKSARFINERIPGIEVPKHIIKRLENSRDREKEGLSITRETLDELKREGSIAGINLMSLSGIDPMEFLG